MSSRYGWQRKNRFRAKGVTTLHGQLNLSDEVKVKKELDK